MNEFYFGSDLDPDDHIRRYVKFKAEQSGISVNEAARRSMSRLYSQIKDDKTIVILTAFRSERSMAENRLLNRQLANDVRSLHWGYTPVLGGYVEKTADGEKRVHEESLFIVANGDPRQAILHVIKLLDKYGQESALIKFPEEPNAFLIYPNGEKSSAGLWQADPSLMAIYYTRMRNGPSGRQFKFEAAGDDSLMTRMAVDHFFKKKR
jgi:hypothetical protein